MSVTMSKANGVTVFTVTSDPESQWPPLCQIFKSLCYSPVCCSVSRQLRKVQGTSLTALGTMQIMIGLLNLGLGAILHCARVNYWTVDPMLPYWLGSLVIIFGIMCILSEKYPSPCLVILNVTLSLVGVALAVTGIVLHCISAVNLYFWWPRCEEEESWYWGRTTPSPSPDREYMKQKCLEGKAMFVMLVRSLYVVLTVLSALELCVLISSTVLGIKALKSRNKEKTQKSDDPELYNPLLEEVTTIKSEA